MYTPQGDVSSEKKAMNEEGIERLSIKSIITTNVLRHYSPIFYLLPDASPHANPPLLLLDD